MNKSRRARKGGEGGSTAQKEGNEKTEEKKKEKKEEKEEGRSPERKTPIKPHVPATYSIFTTLKFPPKGKRPALHHKPPSGKQPKQDTSFQYQESKKPVPDTSFYYKDNSSSNYDLTLARKEQEVVAEVHEASPKVSKQCKLTSADLLINIQSERSAGEGGSSPVPLLPPRVERAEGFYSFRTLQERSAQKLSSFITESLLPGAER